MKNKIIIGINLGDFGSTGNIMRNALEYANKHGDYDYLILVPRSEGKPNTNIYVKYNIFSKIDRHFIHRTIGKPDGLYDYSSTKRIIRIIKTKCKLYYDVIIHLHNIHMCNIDFRILFKYLSEERKIKKIFYTIHDTWPYTGGCYCYNFVGCNKWMTGCKGQCIQQYGAKKISANKIWQYKKKYTMLIKKKITLLPVSNWIANEIKKSFLSSFNSIMIYGGTSLQPIKFKDINLAKKLGLMNKKIILSVSAYWNDWKGYKYLYEIAKKIPNDYVLLIVGGIFDTKNFKNIIHINSIKHYRLSHFFSIADVYISCSQCEALGLTTCEAQICGVPVVAFGHTAIKETFINNKTGILIKNNNIDKMVDAIKFVLKSKPFKKRDIIDNGNRFSLEKTSQKYLKLYNEV